MINAVLNGSNPGDSVPCDQALTESVSCSVVMSDIRYMQFFDSQTRRSIPRAFKAASPDLEAAKVEGHLKFDSHPFVLDV